ncbi:CDP-alcohol phosphatidyltransferase family protein [Candidatus Woesearchaeota archaeon]|nr:CDP-alcohol phosphatidyltransferase family protein [Candidatus Woesearchaeota archaeon]
MLDRYRKWLYNTKFSKAISKLVMLKINPNLITFLGLIFGIIAAYLIYKHFLLLAIIPLILSGLCDLCDGWVARLSHKETKFGVIFDVSLDKYVEGLIGLGYAFITPSFLIPGYIWVIIAVFGSVIISVISNVGAALTKSKCCSCCNTFNSIKFGN